MEFNKTLLLIINLFVSEVDFSIVPNRTDVYTINLEYKFLDGTDLHNLIQKGKQSIDKYVKSGFNLKGLPKRIPLRTDSKEQEIAELGDGKEVDTMIEQAGLNMDKSEYGDEVD